MQHWHVYTKWNERLFQENYYAFLNGRSDKNPADGWYGGELWFFDNYIIPLAKKLKSCGVFGVSSDEFLSYATQNRAEWEQKGNDIVAEMIAKYEPKEEEKDGIDLFNEALLEEDEDDIRAEKEDTAADYVDV